MAMMVHQSNMLLLELQCWQLTSVCSSCVLSLNGCVVICPNRKRNLLRPVAFWIWHFNSAHIKGTISFWSEATTD